MSVGHRCSLLHPQQARVRCPVQLHLDKLDIRVHTLHLMRDIWKMIYFMIERIWWARLQSQNQMRIFCVFVFSDWGASMRVSVLRFPPHLMFSVRLCILPPRPGPICPNMWEGHTVWDTELLAFPPLSSLLLSQHSPCPLLLMEVVRQYDREVLP